MNPNVYDDADTQVLKKIKADVISAAKELVDAAKLKGGQTVIVGCSTSEVMGNTIGNHSVLQVGQAIYDGLAEVFCPLGIKIAAQCCEHLNRAVVVEYSDKYEDKIVSAVPKAKAGGSFATACYNSFENPAVIEEIKADAGMDIGGTLIGMHLKTVAVPVRLKQSKIGEASVLYARTRPKYIGGERTSYNTELS